MTRELVKWKERGTKESSWKCFYFLRRRRFIVLLFKDLFIHAGSQNRTTAVVGRLSRIQLCTSSGRLDNNRRCQLDASLRKESDWNIRRRITALEASPPTAFHLLHADKTRSSLCKRRRRRRKKMRVAAARLIRSGRHWRPLSNFLLKKKKVSGELIPNVFFIING